MLYVERWFAQKYHSTPKSDEYLAYTLEELLVEFFQDMYVDDRKRMWEDEKNVHGEVHLPEVGDAYVDKWEEEFQKGIMPDLTEGLPEKERRAIRERIAEEASILEAQKKANIKSAFSKQITGADQYLK